MNTFRIGDKVKIIASTHYPTARTRAMIGTVGVVQDIDPDDDLVQVGVPDGLDSFWFSPADLEDARETITWQTLRPGDIVIDEDGDERVVLEVLTQSFLVSDYGAADAAGRWWTFTELERCGWSVKQPDASPVETIEIAGKRYNKAEFEQATRHLTEIK